MFLYVCVVIERNKKQNVFHNSDHIKYKSDEIRKYQSTDAKGDPRAHITELGTTFLEELWTTWSELNHAVNQSTKTLEK